MSNNVTQIRSLTNNKFSSILMKEGNLNFPEENVKVIGSSNSTGPVDSISSCGSYSLFQNLYPNMDVINAARSNIAPLCPTVNPYVGSNMLDYPLIHPYLLESMQHAEQFSNNSKQQFPPRLFSMSGQTENYLDIGPHPRRKNATRETTSILKAWLNEHQKNPYPTKGEKIMLAVITKMTLTQVSTWFANARRRLKKENKMTWSPNHKSDDEMDDIDDIDSTELINNASQDLNSQTITNEFLIKMSNIRKESDVSTAEISIPNITKPKIWSIADITSDNDKNDAKDIPQSSNNISQIQTFNPTHHFRPPVLQNPTMQYLLWKHKELYQLHFSNIVSSMQRFRVPIDIKSRIFEENSKSQDDVYQGLQP